MAGDYHHCVWCGFPKISGSAEFCPVVERRGQKFARFGGISATANEPFSVKDHEGERRFV
jgi:hypothetical protein